MSKKYISIGNPHPNADLHITIKQQPAPGRIFLGNGISPVTLMLRLPYVYLKYEIAEIWICSSILFGVLYWVLNAPLAFAGILVGLVIVTATASATVSAFKRFPTPAECTRGSWLFAWLIPPLFLYWLAWTPLHLLQRVRSR